MSLAESGDLGPNVTTPVHLGTILEDSQHLCKIMSLLGYKAAQSVFFLRAPKALSLPGPGARPQKALSAHLGAEASARP